MGYLASGYLASGYLPTGFLGSSSGFPVNPPVSSGPAGRYLPLGYLSAGFLPVGYLGGGVAVQVAQKVYPRFYGAVRSNRYTGEVVAVSISTPVLSAQGKRPSLLNLATIFSPFGGAT